MSTSNSPHFAASETSALHSGHGEAIAAIAFIAESLAADQARCLESTLGSWADTLESEGFDPASLVSLFGEIVERTAAMDPYAAQVPAVLNVESSTLAALTAIRQISPTLLGSLFAHLEHGLDLGDDLSVASGGAKLRERLRPVRRVTDDTHLSAKLRVEVDIAAFVSKDVAAYEVRGVDALVGDLNRQKDFLYDEFNRKKITSYAMPLLKMVSVSKDERTSTLLMPI